MNKTIRYRIVNLKDTFSPFQLPQSPEYLNDEKINRTTNKYLLMYWEKQYDDFLDKHSQLLQLYETIDLIIEIRNKITIAIKKLDRHNRIRENRERLGLSLDEIRIVSGICI